MYKSYHFTSIDSTSTYLKKNYKDYDNLTFVSADFQTHGHGRYNRNWVSRNKENLLFSILIKDQKLIEKYNCLSLASAVCIHDVLENLGLSNVSIKWPNDVLVDDKKICGILLEGISSGGSIDAIVVGIGINVNSTNFNDVLLNAPTSIYLQTKKKTSLDDFKNIVYEKMIETFNDINSGNTEYLDTVRNNNYLKRKFVYANINDKKTLVEVIDINEDNTLKVKLNDEYLDLFSGEITFHL